MSLSSRKFYVCNPLPAITEREVAKLAGLEGVLDYQNDRLAFKMLLQFGSGAEKEALTLEPGGDAVLIDEEYTLGLKVEYEEKGLAIIDDPDRRDAITLQALERAKNFYLGNGTSACLDAIMGKTGDELRHVQHLYHGNVFNDERAKVIEERISELRRPAKKGASSGKKQESVVLS